MAGRFRSGAHKYIQEDLKMTGDVSSTATKCEELRELLRAHGFSSLHEFLDMRDKVNKTSAEIKLKLLREELENKEG